MQTNRAYLYICWTWNRNFKRSMKLLYTKQGTSTIHSAHWYLKTSFHICTNNYNKVKYMYAMMKKTNSMFNGAHCIKIDVFKNPLWFGIWTFFTEEKLVAPTLCTEISEKKLKKRHIILYLLVKRCFDIVIKPLESPCNVFSLDLSLNYPALLIWYW